MIEDSALSINTILPMSSEWISILSGSKIIGWSGKVDSEKESTASQICVDNLDFNVCAGLFKDNKMNNLTHMCGHAVISHQNADFVII